MSELYVFVCSSIRPDLLPHEPRQAPSRFGLFSNQRDEQLAFWQQTVGLPYDHMGKVGGGVQQHRHHMNGSILKVNHARDPLPAIAPSGIIGLQIAREGFAGRRRWPIPTATR